MTPRRESKWEVIFPFSDGTPLVFLLFPSRYDGLGFGVGLADPLRQIFPLRSLEFFRVDDVSGKTKFSVSDHDGLLNLCVPGIGYASVTETLVPCVDESVAFGLTVSGMYRLG